MPKKIIPFEQRVEKITRWLLIILTVFSFILSYYGMLRAGLEAGYGYGAYLLPFVVEASIVILALVQLTAKLNGWDTGNNMLLILIVVGLSVIFNIVHVPSNTMSSRFVVALPPILLFVAFEKWVSLIEQANRVEPVAREDQHDIKARRKTVKSLKLEGLSLKDIAERVGMSVDTVRNDLKALGLK